MNHKLISSSWDNKHLLSLTLGDKLKRNWDLGLKYRYAGGSPYTSFDLQVSQQNYLTLGIGIAYYSRLTTETLSPFTQLDFRVDKQINFKKTALNVYVDIQNILKNKNDSFPKYTFKRTEDNTAFLTNDSQPLKLNGANAIPFLLNTKSGNLIPSFGVILEF